MARHDGALSPRAARGSCPSTRASSCSAAGTAAMRGTSQQAGPRRGSRACAAALVHGAAHGRAARALPAQSAAHAHSPLAPAVEVGQGPLRTVSSMHARSV